jgi:hypothetical protein
MAYVVADALSERFLYGSFIAASGPVPLTAAPDGRKVADVIKVMLVCDSCSAVIANGISANAVRLEAQAVYRRRAGKDLCLTCEALALPSPTAERASPSTSELLFACPITGRPVPTGIETDVESLRASWKSVLKLDCPHCGEGHELSVRETYLNRALKEASERSG